MSADSTPVANPRSMNRREALRLGAGAAALGAMTPLMSLPLLEGCRSAPARAPNILFIFSDDHACQAHDTE